MKFKRFVTCALLSGLALVPAVEAANAACGANPTGFWSFFSIEVNPSANSNANSIACDLDFGGGGSFTAACKSYQTGMSGFDNASPTGMITMGANCAFTGTITISGNPMVTIRDGQINGNIGSGIATQGNGNKTSVMLFTLVKR